MQVEDSHAIILVPGPVAQWLAQTTHNRLVAGPTPAGPTFDIKIPPAQNTKSASQKCTMRKRIKNRFRAKNLQQ